eukprot:TRINITY_DN2087_c0_g1_i1.p1 TRINITY_DN2087_c0_g1~~TRINITY_DN2087_c0_g1_i1.p1  ORF type:complete len:365 (+),score=143.27 TRINITY_DN2087_c0_g1_i1:43-1095(+)
MAAPDRLMAVPGDELKAYQRRGYLQKEFPDASPHVVNCCANDALGLGLEATGALMKAKWHPMRERLDGERARLVEVLERDPPRCYTREPAAGKDAKKADKKKKSRLQGGAKPAPKRPASAASANTWGAVAMSGAQESVTRGPSAKLPYDVIRPGLVLFKNAIPLAVQQHFVDVSVAIGTPTNGLSGGWYSVGGNGTRRWNTGETWGQMSEALASFPKQYRGLCRTYLDLARAASPADLPDMDPNLVLLNFYEPTGPGIYWHRDNSAGERRAVELGLPVVSFSLGDSCVFAWKTDHDMPVQELVLDSGDVLVFGGPSRLIHHAVPKIYPNTAPKALEMPQGRLNLTFRQQI